MFKMYLDQENHIKVSNSKQLSLDLWVADGCAYTTEDIEHQI